MNNLISRVYKQPLKLFTLFTFIFPIFPLVLLSIWAVFMALFSIFSTSASVNSGASLWTFLIIIWMLGGSAGFVGAILSLLKKYNKTTFGLFVYGAFSYSIIAVTFFVALLSKFTLVNIIFALYLLMTLVVIVMQIVRLYEKVQQQKKRQTAMLGRS